MFVCLGLVTTRLFWILALSSAPVSPTTFNITADGAQILSTKEKSLSREEALNLDKEVSDVFESAKRTLEAYKDVKSSLLTSSIEILRSNDTEDGIASQIKEVERMQDEISVKKVQIDRRIREINALQILDLKAKVELLQKREHDRRALLIQKEEFKKRRQLSLQKKKEKLKKKREAAKEKKSIKNIIPKNAVKKNEFEDHVDAIAKEALERSDKRIIDMFIEIVEQEVDALQVELEEAVIDATTGLQEIEELKTVNNDPNSSEECSGATLADATQIVQESLVKFSHDKVGMVDHLAHAQVVHLMTSQNFVPPSYAHQSLEDLWWFQFVPDDWEKLFDAILPKGWRQWNMAIPDYIYHTFGLHGRAVTASPEAILKPSLHPGSCWPMAGRSGHVTLRLPYPVIVKAVTIDHAPSLLFEDQTKRHSAPRKVRVFGFPSCWTKKPAGKTSELAGDYLDEGNQEDAEYFRGTCKDGLDFDVSEPVILHDFEYDLEGPSIQTFHVPLQDEHDEGSCTQDTGTCGGGLDGSPADALFLSPMRSDSIKEGMSAIRLEVIDNWGNEDYTCIYRFRIHGDPIDPKEN